MYVMRSDPAHGIRSGAQGRRDKRTLAGAKSR